jgi:dTDP-L-rhamnose 4-epimerase
MEKEVKKILITGGAGFIGSNIALKLTSMGHEVTILDILSKQIHGYDPESSSPLYLSIKNKVNFVLGSVTNRNDLTHACQNQQVIVHLAAETGTGQSMYEIEKYVNVNITGTAIMLDILANNNNTVEKIIVGSSRAIYGEGKYSCNNCGIVYPETRREADLKNKIFACKCPHCNDFVEKLPTSEESKIHPTSIYGITKQNQEQMVMTVCNTIGISPVVFRYQNVYGPGQSLTNPYTGILSIFSTIIKNGNEINIFEDGKESRDFVYIDDVVEATISGIFLDSANSGVFNVGAGVATSVLNVAQTLIQYYKSNTPVSISGNYRLGDIRHNYADLTEINSKLGFSPKVSFYDGISKFCDWVATQKIQKDNYEKSIQEMKSRGLYK